MFGVYCTLVFWVEFPKSTEKFDIRERIQRDARFFM